MRHNSVSDSSGALVGNDRASKIRGARCCAIQFGGLRRPVIGAAEQEHNRVRGDGIVHPEQVRIPDQDRTVRQHTARRPPDQISASQCTAPAGNDARADSAVVGSIGPSARQRFSETANTFAPLRYLREVPLARGDRIAGGPPVARSLVAPPSNRSFRRRRNARQPETAQLLSGDRIDHGRCCILNAIANLYRKPLEIVAKTEHNTTTGRIESCMQGSLSDRLRTSGFEERGSRCRGVAGCGNSSEIRGCGTASTSAGLFRGQEETSPVQRNRMARKLQ